MTKPHNQSLHRPPDAPVTRLARATRVPAAGAGELNRYMSIGRACASVLLLMLLVCRADADDGNCPSGYGTEGRIVALRDRATEPMYYYSSAGDDSFAYFIAPEILMAQLSTMTRSSTRDPVTRLLMRMKPDLPLQRDANLSQYPGSAPYVQAALWELLEKGEVQIQDRTDPAMPVFVSKVRIIPIVGTDIAAHTLCFPSGSRVW